MSKKCIQCGAELENDAMFCDECGAAQKVEKVKKTSVPAEKKSSDGLKTSGIGIISCICGVISICTLGLFVIPEILGIIFGIIALLTKNVKHVVDIVGLVLSIAALVVLFILIVIGVLL